MKDIQQLIKKNSQEGRYEDIFPKTFTDAVKDKESGKSLIDILSSFNMYFLSYNGSRELTRLQVPLSLRKTGLWITYVLYDKTVVTEWYAGEAIDDDSWKSPDNWRVGTNMLVGDISISSDGYWVVNGVITTTKAQGEQGITPMLRVGSNNHLQVSYTNGSSWIDVSTNPVYTQFRINNNKLEQSVDLGDTWIVVSDELAYQFRNSGNKLQVSKDLGVTWEDTSDYIAAWFKFTGTTGSSQNVGKIQISRDNGVTWSDLSGEFTNSLHIKGYVATVGALPSSAVQGDIYGVGPTYDPSDTGQTNPIYQLYVKDSTGWVNNGKFTSIAAGVVQTTGTSTTDVMSQKAVTDELNALETDLNDLEQKVNMYGVAGGTPQNITLTVDATITELKAGMVFKFRPLPLNTVTAPTLSVNEFPAYTILKGIHTSSSTALVAYDMLSTIDAIVEFDGEYFRLLNPQSGGFEQVRSQSTNKVPSSKVVDDELNELEHDMVLYTDRSNLSIYGKGALAINNGLVSSYNNYVIDGGSHLAIPVHGGDSISIVIGSYSAQVFWVKKYTKPTSTNTTPLFCTGYETRRTLTTGTYLVPVDATYMVVGYLSDATNIFPTDISINDFSINDSILDFIKANIDALGVAYSTIASHSETLVEHSEFLDLLLDRSVHVIRQGSFGNPTSPSTVSGTNILDVQNCDSVRIYALSTPASGYIYRYGFRTFAETSGDPRVLIPIRDISANVNLDNDTIELNIGENGIAFTITEYNGTAYNGTVSYSKFNQYPTYIYKTEPTENAYTRNKSKEGILINACRMKIDSSESKDVQLILLGDQHEDTIAINNAIDISNGFDSIDGIINMGDCSDTYPSVFSNSYIDLLNKSNKPVYHTLGNHDIGYSPLVADSGSNLQGYNKWIAPIISKGWLNEGEYEVGKSYYYHDFTQEGRNARLIVLNAYDDANEFYEGYWKAIVYSSSYIAIGSNGTSYVIGDKINIPGFTEYSFECVAPVTLDSSYSAPTRPSYKFYRGVNVIRQTQAQWFLDTLCSTPKDFGVIVAIHLVPSENFEINRAKGGVFCQDLNKTASDFGNYGMETDFVANAINAFVNGVNYSETVSFKSYTGFDGLGADYGNSYTVNKDFTAKNTGVKFNCVIFGHTHYDLIWKHNSYNIYGVNIVSAQTDYERTHVFGGGKTFATDIVRTNTDGIAKDSLTVASFNMSESKVSLVKVGVDTTINGVKRDFAVLDF